MYGSRTVTVFKPAFRIPCPTEPVLTVDVGPEEDVHCSRRHDHPSKEVLGQVGSHQTDDILLHPTKLLRLNYSQCIYLCLETEVENSPGSPSPHTPGKIFAVFCQVCFTTFLIKK